MIVNLLFIKKMPVCVSPELKMDFSYIIDG